MREAASRHQKAVPEGCDGRSSTIGQGRAVGLGVTALCIPLVQGNSTLGPLYLEAEAAVGRFDPKRIAAATLLAMHAASAMEAIRLACDLGAVSEGRRAAEETLRETHNALLKHQEIGRMGDFRFNTCTLESFGSLECYKLFGYEEDLSAIDFSTWTTKIVDEDRQWIIDELAACIVSNGLQNWVWRISRADWDESRVTLTA